MKNNILQSLIIIALVLSITGCGSKYNKSVTTACNNTIKELQYYVDGKEDIKELEYNVRSYEKDCIPSEDNASEKTICLAIGNIPIEAYLSGYSNKKDLVKFEEKLKDLKELCR